MRAQSKPKISIYVNGKYVNLFKLNKNFIFIKRKTLIMQLLITKDKVHFFPMANNFIIIPLKSCYVGFEYFTRYFIGLVLDINWKLRIHLIFKYGEN